MKALPGHLPILETLPLGRTQPLSLHDPSSAWFVSEGNLDVFIVMLQPDGLFGSRTHFSRIEEGQWLFPLPGGDQTSGLAFIAVGNTGTVVQKIALQDLQTLANSAASFSTPALVGWLEAWVQTLYAQMKGGTFPEHLELLPADGEVEVDTACGFRPESGVIWIEHLQGSSQIAGFPALEASPASRVVPLASTSWGQAASPATIRSLSTPAALEKNLCWIGLSSINTLLLQWVQLALEQNRSDEGARLTAKADAEAKAVKGAVSDLSSLFQTSPNISASAAPGSSPLMAACLLIGQSLGIPMKAPAGLKQPKALKDPLRAIAKASRVRLRRVVLAGDWWSQDNGPLLAYTAEENKPVALLPSSASTYQLADPSSPNRQIVTADVAHSLNPVAYSFSRPFPEAAVQVIDLLKFGFYGSERDIVMMLILGTAGGLLGMLNPIVTGIIFDSVIPSAGRTDLFYLSGALLVGALAGTVFHVIRGLALLRLEAKSDASIQGAVWDRLLSLPLPFFRNYTSGDLADRANGISAIRAIASGAVLSAVLSGVFSIFNFVLLFHYSVQLALIATALVLIHVVLSVGISLLSLRYQRPIYDLQGKISGQVLQFITGITKLRVAGAEVHAYAVWARNFADQKKLHLRTSKIFNRFSVFGEIYPILTTVSLFMGIVFLVKGHISTGMFLAFSASFTTFLYAMLDLSDALISLLHAVPLYERAKPILATLPEVSEEKAEPGELRGRIELSRVSFRYKTDGPLVLKDLSLQIHPGEFVAIVGPSGSGKSTLIRLLLGFDKPEFGTISYDGMDLAGLDVQSVRRQLGVVLQNGKLMPGDIFQNIIGSAQLTIEDAWEAAQKAGLDEDIHQMPMGMHTVLSEGAGTLSGGQRQRLMIARAIVAKPRILIFDEATSALDNRTQAIVSRSLERLKATRIVIAHRLSTIINADRIFVIQSGKLLQSGTYTELVNQPGPFSELAKRQLA